MTELTEGDQLSPLHQPMHVGKTDQLMVRVYADRQAMGAGAARHVAAQVRELQQAQQQVRMIFTAAPSQTETLQALRHERGIDWSAIAAFHMDEYLGLPAGAPQQFSTWLCDRLFSIVQPGELHLINGSHAPAEECKRYGDLIRSAPTDIVCLGIGENGHLAFNAFNVSKTFRPTR